MPLPRTKPLPNSRLTRQDWNNIAEFVKRCMMITGGWGIRVTNLPNGVGLSLDENAIKPGFRMIRAMIVDSTPDEPSGDTNRWRYSWCEVQKIAKGYGIVNETTGNCAWSKKTNGMSGSQNAFNYIEAMNDGEDKEMNGIDVDGADFPAGFFIQPAPAGVIVLLNEVVYAIEEENKDKLDEDGKPIVELNTYTEYWFAYENAVDGSC